MKIAITGDWQADIKCSDALLGQVDAMSAVCARNGIELVLHGGDTFEHSMIGSAAASTGYVLELINECFKKFDPSIYHIMIPGNHETSGMSQRDALHHFGMVGNISVVRSPGFSMYGGVKIFCLPWSWAGDNPEEKCADATTIEHDIFLGHCNVVGAKMGKTTCPDAPGKWQISREFLESVKARHVALYHLHNRHSLCAAGGYGGALLQQDHGNEGDPAGFEIYDTLTGSVEWVELDAAPKHQTYIVDEHNPAPKPEDIPANIKARVRYSRGIDDRVAARQLEEAGAQVEEEVEVAERVKRADVKPGIIHQKHDLIRLYAESQNPPIEGQRLAAMQGAFDDIIADKSAA